MDKFWIVWKEDGSVPVRKHGNQSTAISEALRLACKEKAPAYVFEAVGRYIPPELNARWEGVEK